MTAGVICLRYSMKYEIHILTSHSCFLLCLGAEQVPIELLFRKLDAPRGALLPHYKSPFSPAGGQNPMNKIFF